MRGGMLALTVLLGCGSGAGGDGTGAATLGSASASSGGSASATDGGTGASASASAGSDGTGTTGSGGTGSTGGADLGDGGSGTGGPCAPEGTTDCPILVDTFPTVDARDTTVAPSDVLEGYSCAPGINETGSEFVYQIEAPADGIITAWVGDGAGVDVDVHLLGSTDAGSCITRDDTTVGWRVEAGTWYLVVDTWVDGGGVEQAGAYDLRVDFLDGQGTCGLEMSDQDMHWTACDPGLDCYQVGGEYGLHLPALGPVVKEAHLVTVDDGFGAGWPTSFTDGIDSHYSVSEGVSGFAGSRTEPWAPAGEGGSEYGQGSTGVKVPVLDEAWYVNMYWKPRPPGGTRVLVYDPATGKAVVASGGYETGPGANDAIGGAVEEIHMHLGTGHLDRLVMGYLVDDQLPLGPVTCP